MLMRSDTVSLIFLIIFSLVILDPFPQRTGLKIGFLSSDSVGSNELVHYVVISSGSSLFV